jgi:hypothetical protein
MKVARKGDVKRIIAHGGRVQFTYRTGTALLVSADGEIQYQLDRRTYAAFLRVIAPHLSRTDSGSAETNDFDYRMEAGQEGSVLVKLGTNECGHEERWQGSDHQWNDGAWWKETE